MLQGNTQKYSLRDKIKKESLKIE